MRGMRLNDDLEINTRRTVDGYYLLPIFLWTILFVSHLRMKQFEIANLWYMFLALEGIPNMLQNNHNIQVKKHHSLNTVNST